jgi:hypothetical protein
MRNPPAGTCALTDTLSATVPALPDTLVGAQARHRLDVAAACLPAALTNWIYLETTLDDLAERLDLIVRVDPSGRSHLRLDELILPAPLDARATQVWRRVEALARLWEENSCGWHESVAGLWLEFDLALDAERLPAPRLFLDFATDSREPRDCARALAPLTALVGAAPPLSLGRQLQHCFDALPEHADVPSLGLADPSRWADVRLCAAGLRDADLAPYLRAVGWPGDAEALAADHAALTARLEPSPETISLLHLDISTGVGARVGLEYLLSRSEQRHGQLRETSFLDALDERGCDPAKREALAHWPGQNVGTLPHEIWPSLVSRRVNHVKVVHEPRGAQQIKAYLSLSHDFHRRAAPLLYR